MRNHKFLAFLGYFRGHPRDQKGSTFPISLKVAPHPEAAYLHREMISQQRFDTVTHLGQIKNFDQFWGHPGRLMGVQKSQKLPMALITIHKSYTFARVDNFS